MVASNPSPRAAKAKCKGALASNEDEELAELQRRFHALDQDRQVSATATMGASAPRTAALSTQRTQRERTVAANVRADNEAELSKLKEYNHHRKAADVLATMEAGDGEVPTAMLCPGNDSVIKWCANATTRHEVLARAESAIRRAEAQGSAREAVRAILEQQSDSQKGPVSPFGPSLQRAGKPESFEY